MLNFFFPPQHGTLCKLSKFGDDIKLEKVVGRPDSCAIIQKDTDKLEKMKKQEPPEVQQRKCKDLHLC